MQKYTKKIFVKRFEDLFPALSLYFENIKIQLIDIQLFKYQIYKNLSLSKISVLSQFFHKNPGSFCDFVLKITPKVLDCDVVFQFACRLDVFDVVFLDAFGKLVENHCVDAFVLVFLVDGDEQQVDGVVMFQRPQQMDESEREQAAVGFLHGLRQRREGDAKRHDFV